jgi:ABC-type lipoprotein release transport system permease subunit
MGANLRLVVLLALRNVAAHRVKSAIVGSILFFGTFLVVSGRALIQSIEHAMETSITSSLAGHLQVYAKDAKDPLALFGGGGFGSSDIGEIPDAGANLAPIAALDNVKAIVPMGITNATVFSGNELDGVLSELRDAVGRGDTVAREAGAARVRAIVDSLGKGLLATASQATDRARAEEDRAALTRVTEPAFWEEFNADPLPALDFLDARVAPLAADGRLLYLRTIGTDLQRFGQSFDRFYMVDGEPIPPGRRGYLFSKRTYERIVKNKVARELDAIREEVREKGKTIAGETLLKERVARMARQFQRVTFQLSPEEASTLETRLATELGETGPLDTLVQRFLTVDDANLERRYAFFYDVIAPMIQLYDVPVGSVVTLRAFTKSGFVRSINVKVYGTYEFKGLEESDLSSASNLTDMITFRELYGKMTAEQKEELAAIAASVGVADVSRDDAEAALFGGGTAEVAVPEPSPASPTEEVRATLAANGAPDGVAATDALIASAGPRIDERTYSEDEIRSGLALNAAIILEDPARLDETRAAIEARIAQDGLNLQVVNWQQAAGLLGQFILVIRAVLTVAIAIIFLVAMVIINNSMVMATMDRVGEIGTMRAIGAHRRWVVGVFLLETLLLGVIAGGAGAAAGVGLVQWLGQQGLPAASDALVVLFAGPRLYPAWSATDVLFGLVVVTLVGLASTLYPAVLASRIQPVVAMQGKE